MTKSSTLMFIEVPAPLPGNNNNNDNNKTIENVTYNNTKLRIL